MCGVGEGLRPSELGEEEPGTACSGRREGRECRARGEGERRGRREEKKRKEERKKEKWEKEKEKEGRERERRERERDSRRNRRPVGHARCLGARERDALVEGETGRWIWLSGLGPTGIGRSGGKTPSSTIKKAVFSERFDLVISGCYTM